MEHQQGDTEAVRREDRLVPPRRQATREQRREATLRALAAGEEALCAYCGEVLPPIPSRGGRPTPYCPADAERYGQWGAKTITCAMLDEHREMWVQVYGPNQPMTHLDVHALDERLASLHAVLDPVRDEVAGLQAHVSTELRAALQARDSADAERREAREQVRAAAAQRDEALVEAAGARDDAEAARTAQAEEHARAAQAIRDRDQAIAARNAAQHDAETARGDRQHALAQLNTAQQRIAELQNTLAGERATALEQLDQLRREEEQAREAQRLSLTEECEQRLRAQAEDFTQRLRAGQADADRRITELAGQLSEATRSYAGSLAPLHDRIAALQAELAEQAGKAADAWQQVDDVRKDLARCLELTDADTIRDLLQATLDRTAGTPRQQSPGHRAVTGIT
jgi:chromosome segregation ATPase